MALAMAARSDLRIVSDPEELARAGAGEFVRAAADAVRRRGLFSVALAGGSTPRGLYQALAGEGARGLFRGMVAWDKAHVFWGDERPVPPGHPDSNYRMAREALLSRVPIPEGNVHRIKGEEPEARRAAEEYEADLRAHFRAGPGAWPRFDLVLLGLGKDGHTASLFPGSEALRETGRLAVAPWIDSLRSHRITLTIPVLNHAARVLFLVSGAEKAEIVRVVLEDEPGPDPYPARLIRPRSGALIFIVDRPAAGRIAQGPGRPSRQ